MRTATITASGSAGLMAIAWPSSIPSSDVSLTILLFRCGFCASRTRLGLQSFQLSPPSVVRITPPTSSAAKIVPGLEGCCAMRITRQENGITHRVGMLGSGSRFHVSPLSSLRYTAVGEPPA